MKLKKQTKNVCIRHGCFYILTLDTYLTFGSVVGQRASTSHDDNDSYKVLWMALALLFELPNTNGRTYGQGQINMSPREDGAFNRQTE